MSKIQAYDVLQKKGKTGCNFFNQNKTYNLQKRFDVNVNFMLQGKTNKSLTFYFLRHTYMLLT